MAVYRVKETGRLIKVDGEPPFAADARVVFVESKVVTTWGSVVAHMHGLVDLEPVE